MTVADRSEEWAAWLPSESRRGPRSASVPRGQGGSWRKWSPGLSGTGAKRGGERQRSFRLLPESASGLQEAEAAGHREERLAARDSAKTTTRKRNQDLYWDLKPTTVSPPVHAASKDVPPSDVIDAFATFVTSLADHLSELETMELLDTLTSTVERIPVEKLDEAAFMSDVLLEPLSARDRVSVTVRAVTDLIRLRRSVLASGLSAGQAAEELGVTTAQLEDWRAEGRVLGLAEGGGDPVYPAWQFTESAVGGQRLVDGLDELLKSLATLGDLETAGWFLTPKPELEGLTPEEALRKQGITEGLLDLARRVSAR